MKILIEESVLRQALTEMENANDVALKNIGIGLIDTNAITALRTAIEQMENAEPVGRMVGHHNYGAGQMPTIRWKDGYWPTIGTQLFTHPELVVPSQEPVAVFVGWVDGRAVVNLNVHEIITGTKLYTAPGETK